MLLRRVSVLVSILLPILAAPCLAQDVRYIGRATAALIEDPNQEAEGVLIGDIGANGLDDGGEAITQKECDAGQALCFDEDAAGAGEPDLLAFGAVETTGGARSETGVSRPGFPRVESRAAAIVLTLAPALELVVGESRAVADSFTGELFGEATAVVLRIGGPGGLEVPIPVDEGIEIPGIGFLLAGPQEIIARDGLSIIQQDGAVLDSPTLGKVTLGRTIAGLELAQTTGGGIGGGGGCAITRAPHHGGTAMVAATLALLWIVARRRKHRA